MSSTGQIISTMAAEPGAVRTEARLRLPAQARDLLSAPVHDLAVRDHILLQFCPLRPGMRLLEAGPGSGYTAFRLARVMRRIELVDAAPESVEALRQQFAWLPNIQVTAANLADSSWPTALRGCCDVAFALDVFEYVFAPAAGLRNLAGSLERQGMLFLTFPNVPPPVGDGVNYYRTRAELETQLRGAGFVRWEIFAVRLRPWASAVFQLMHELPLRLYRRSRRAGAERPQTYEGTWAFRHRRQAAPLKLVLHSVWGLQELLMRAGGPLYYAYPVGSGSNDCLYGHQLVVRAWV